jgi:hypothetical protein
MKLIVLVDGVILIQAQHTTGWHSVRRSRVPTDHQLLMKNTIFLCRANR